MWKMAQIKMGEGSSQYRFAVLGKIVRHMRQRRVDGEYIFLKLDEILDETNQLEVGIKIKHWISTKALKRIQR